MNNRRALIVVGVSGSGKSTIAKDWINNGNDIGFDVVHIERDNFRREILSERGVDITTQNMWRHWKWKHEKEVNVRWDSTLSNAVEFGLPIVISDTNLRKDRVDELEIKLKSHGYVVDVIVNNVNLAECIKRDLNRLHSVGEAVIFEQYMKLVKSWNVRRQYIKDPTLPRTILVDIDGTIAHMNDKRGAFEWMKVGMDDVDDHVRFIVNAFYNQGMKIVFLSGRDSVCREQTEKWLKDNGIRYHDLFMREKDDMRSDYIIKEELFWSKVVPKYSPELVLDDRKQVVMNVWHPLGIKVLQAGNAYLDF